MSSGPADPADDGVAPAGAERFDRGSAVLERLGPAAGPSAMAKLSSLLPELPRLMVESCFGEVTARPGLDLRTRQIVVVVTLAVLGRHDSLARHVQYARNLGITRDELVEILMQASVYAGIPAAHNAIEVVATVWSDADDTRRAGDQTDG